MHNLRRVLFNTQAGYAITLLRITTGLTFAAHGAQKLFGWFGGYGLEGTGQWMASIGLEPGVLMALLAGMAALSSPEAFCSAGAASLDSSVVSAGVVC